MSSANVLSYNKLNPSAINFSARKKIILCCEAEADFNRIVATMQTNCMATQSGIIASGHNTSYTAQYLASTALDRATIALKNTIAPIVVALCDTSAGTDALDIAGFKGMALGVQTTGPSSTVAAVIEENWGLINGYQAIQLAVNVGPIATLANWQRYQQVFECIDNYLTGMAANPLPVPFTPSDIASISTGISDNMAFTGFHNGSLVPVVPYIADFTYTPANRANWNGTTVIINSVTPSASGY